MVTLARHGDPATGDLTPAVPSTFPVREEVGEGHCRFGRDGGRRP